MLVLLLSVTSGFGLAEKKSVYDRIQNEVSGGICFEHVRFLSNFHRLWGSDDYSAAVKYLLDKAEKYGLSEIKVEKFPIRTGGEQFWMHSTQGRVPWNLKAGSLRLASPYSMLISDTESAPSTVAAHSRAVNCRAEVVYIPDAEKPASYKGKDVKGRIVLAEGDRHREIHQTAVHMFGALGTIHFDEITGPFHEAEAIYWEYIYPQDKESGRDSTFGFVVSASQGKMLKKLMGEGRKVEVDAFVDAEIPPEGTFDLATAVIPGVRYPDEEFIFYSHLDHPKPGAQDNASGNAVMLEIARSLSALIRKGLLPPPARTIRFMWIPHMNGLNMYFHRYPEKVGKVKGGCNIDCVGGDASEFPTQLYAAFPPHSLPTILTDITRVVIEDFNRQMRMENVMGERKNLLFSPEGSRNLEQVLPMPYLGFSDEYTANTITLDIPSIYFFNDPLPPRHNQINFLKYIDRTSLKRVAYLGAAVSYIFSSIGEKDVPFWLNEIKFGSETRLLDELRKSKNALEESGPDELAACYAKGLNLLKWGIRREYGMPLSLKKLSGRENRNAVPFESHMRWLDDFDKNLKAELTSVYRSKFKQSAGKTEKEAPSSEFSRWEDKIPVADPEMKGSPGYFSHYFESRLGEDFLSKYPGVRRSFRYGNVGYYETLNYIDGRNSIEDIFNAVQAELWSGEYPEEHSLEKEEMLNYLLMLRDAGVIRIEER